MKVIKVTPYEIPEPATYDQVPRLGPRCHEVEAHAVRGVPACVPDTHYLLHCPNCGANWQEAPLPGVYRCPWCAGAKVSVSGAADCDFTFQVKLAQQGA